MANESEPHRSDGRPPGDRRALVFACFALVSWALYPLADRYDESDGWHWGSHGWAFVPAGLGAVYLVLALLSLLDHRSRQKLEARPLLYDRHDRDGGNGLDRG